MRAYPARLRMPGARISGGAFNSPHSRRWRSARCPEGSGSAALRHRRRAMNAATPLPRSTICRRDPVDAGVARLFDACRQRRHGEPCRPQWRRQDNADALHHGSSQPARAPSGSKGRPVRAATPCPRRPRDRLHAGRPLLVPQLTVEENILLPLWVAEHLDRKARLDFVYEVIGELTEMRHRKRCC